jgi:sugar lactone lactonase YvrE
MPFGSGKYSYEVVEGWGKLPEGWHWGWIPGVAVDSQDRVFVYSRSEHPLVLFDTGGNFLESWGEDVLLDAHGIFIDKEDNVWCTEWNAHCIRKFNKHGELQMTIGTPGQPGARPGDPFNLPTDLAIASTGEIFISDGYGNHRVHKYSPDGELIKSWGEEGEGPGQFKLSHCVRLDKEDRVWVCDRTNDRIQIFDTDGNFLDQWTGLLKPDTIYIDPHEDVVYVAELTQQVSVYTMTGELLTKWGGAQPSDRPGEFIACPHGIWADSKGDLYVGQVQADGQLQKFARLS